MGIRNIFHILTQYIKYKLMFKKIIMISACSGFGDYLWHRNVAYSIKKDKKYKDFKIIVITTHRWNDFVIRCDSNLYDLIIPISNPAHIDKPLLMLIQFLKCNITIQLDGWIDEKHFSTNDFYKIHSYSFDVTKFIYTQFIYKATDLLRIQTQYAPLPTNNYNGGGGYCK